MWIDDTDLTQLAQRLRLGPRELIEAIGGPWYVVTRSMEQEVTMPGTLFVGRAGPSVGVLVSDDPVPSLHVGVATGEWYDPGTLVWSLSEPITRFRALPVNAPDAEASALLGALAAATDEAFAVKRSHLIVCRFCGNLVAPEHALGDDICHGCGETIRGIVY